MAHSTIKLSVIAKLKEIRLFPFTNSTSQVILLAFFQRD